MIFCYLHVGAGTYHFAILVIPHSNELSLSPILYWPHDRRHSTRALSLQTGVVQEYGVRISIGMERQASVHNTT